MAIVVDPVASSAALATEVALGQAPEAAGAVTTYESAKGASAARSVALGVTTGVLIWFVTRWLDGKFIKRRRK